MLEMSAHGNVAMRCVYGMRHFARSTNAALRHYRSGVVMYVEM